MKKIYLTLCSVLLCAISNAQTLTALANEPSQGDVNSKKKYDSVGVVPKNTGAGLNWDFGAFTQTTVNAISTYSNAGSIPSASNFPGSTLVELQGADKLFWKSVASPTPQFELLGMEQVSGVVLSYTNSAKVIEWPVAMGYSVTDFYSGTLSVGGNTGTVDGTITTQATGTGSLNLPGNFPMNNILQIKMTQTLQLLVPSFGYTNDINSTDYSYYQTGQKFPLVTVSYERETETIVTPTVNFTVKIHVNNAVLTGLNEKNFDATFQIFPNPAKDAFHVNLYNNSNEDSFIEIYSVTGKMEKKIILDNVSTIKTDISIRDLNPGVYLVKTTVGPRQSTRKLIVE
ncbi:MAG: T9SS type A sorting domain-containing protein [Sphingobacteriaceae bacterium]|nr:T9SS type A sorting domain-containing protein [Sphingobacteriaceae bacterium]